MDTIATGLVSVGLDANQFEQRLVAPALRGVGQFAATVERSPDSAARRGVTVVIPLIGHRKTKAKRNPMWS